MDLARALSWSRATAAANQTDVSTKTLNDHSSSLVHVRAACRTPYANAPPTLLRQSSCPCRAQYWWQDLHQRDRTRAKCRLSALARPSRGRADGEHTRQMKSRAPPPSRGPAAGVLDRSSLAFEHS